MCTFNFVRFEFTQVTQVLVLFFFFRLMLCREKLTQDETVRFIKGNELKVTQVDLHSSFIFKSVVNFINR